MLVFRYATRRTNQLGHYTVAQLSSSKKVGTHTHPQNKWVAAIIGVFYTREPHLPLNNFRIVHGTVAIIIAVYLAISRDSFIQLEVVVLGDMSGG
jgi:hypothetical protein